MVAFEEFTFVIPGYTPETIPLARLMEYLKELIAVLGDPKDVHLAAINPGSVSPILHISPREALSVRDRVQRFRCGKGSARQRSAAGKIANMLRQDAPGLAKTVVLSSQNMVLFEIASAPATPEALTGISQPTTLTGQLTRIGGLSETASLELLDSAGETFRGIKAPRQLAKGLAKLLWEPVRLTGTGNWTRSADGKWQLDRLDVQSFDVPNNQSLSTVIEHLRSAEVDWPEDILDRLSKERRGY
jgi:hypothetical protein